MKKAVILESLGISDDYLKALMLPFEREGVKFSVYARTDDRGELIRCCRGADALILCNMPLPEEVLRACPSVRFIDVGFTGVDHIGLAAARERGITVSNASGYANEAVAELVIGAALSLLRRIPQMDARCREGQDAAGFVGAELMGKTVGIVGYGRIGRRTGELFHAFGAKILAQSRHWRSDIPDYVCQTTLEELLSRADIVALHCPLNESTRHLLDRKRLALMKPSAFLINAARAAVVEETALLDALDRHTIAGAAIDVFSSEPPLDPNLPLLHRDNVLLTPHIAYASEQSMLRRAEIVFENLRAFQEGRAQNVVPL